jgi:hypothetical protein
MIFLVSKYIKKTKSKKITNMSILERLLDFLKFIAIVPVCNFLLSYEMLSENPLSLLIQQLEPHMMV